jgi:hypothetical protein
MKVVPMKVVDPSCTRQKNSGLGQIGTVKKQTAISTGAGLLATALTTYPPKPRVGDRSATVLAYTLIVPPRLRTK